MTLKVAALCCAYLFAVVLANLAVVLFGPWALPATAFLMIGFTMSLRDVLQDAWSARGVFVLIAIAALLTWLGLPHAGRIALASVTAFAFSETSDMAVYTLLHRKPYLVRSNASNVAGSAVDSLLFPLVAFGAVAPPLFAAQFLTKLAGGAVWAFLLHRFIHTRTAHD